MIASPFYPFVADNLDHAPNGPGVYGLYVRDGRTHRTIYIGGSLTSVRTSLHRHLLANGQACTRTATHFNTEITDVEYVVSRQAAILTAHRKAAGEFPLCNDPQNVRSKPVM